MLTLFSPNSAQFRRISARPPSMASSLHRGYPLRVTTPGTPIPTLDYSGPPDSAPARPRWREWLIVILLCVAALVVLGPRMRLSQWQATTDDLQPAGEAMAWLDGRLDLPSRGGDV